MTRASDLARLIGAGGTLANDVTISEGSPSIKLNDTDTSRFIDILYGTRNATFRNTMASGEDMDTVAPEIIFSTKDDGETREHFRMNKSEAVFNEGSVDLDFRVESDGNANMFVVDAGLNAVSIGGGPSTNYQLKVAKSDGSVQQLLSAAANFNSTISFGDPDANTSGEIIYAHNGDSMRFHTNATERMRIDSSGRVGIGTTPTAEPLIVQSDSDTDFSASSANFNTALMLKNATSGASNCVSLGLATETNGEVFISAVQNSGNDAADLAFSSRDSGARAERMRIFSDGTISVGSSSSTGGDQVKFNKVGNSGFLLNLNNAGQSSKNLISAQSGTAEMVHCQFNNSNGNVGTIKTSGSSTVYNTSSDYRLKENVVEIKDATARLKQLKPYRFNFIADADTTLDGFLAHEVQTIVPEAVSGEKDAVNADGKIDPQGIDQSKLVPLLTKALQEQQATIEALTARITALEGS